MRAKLNNRGLVKLVEYLEAEAPGIAKKIAICDGKLVIDDIELTATVLEAAVMPPETVDMTAQTLQAAKQLSPEAANDLSKPGAVQAQPPLQQASQQQTPAVIGKGPNSQVQQVGRAAQQRQQQATAQMNAAQMGQISKDQLQQALQTMAQGLK